METETKDVTAESSVDDILKQSPDAQAEEGATPPEPSTENEQVEGAEETSSEDVKPETETPEADVDDTKDIKEGQPVPYARFKQINEERKEVKTELKELQEAQGQFDALLQDPDVLRVIRRKQGLNDDAINAELKEMGIEVKTEPTEPPKFDLTTTEGWEKKFDFMLNQAIDKRMKPVEQTLTQTQRQEQERVLGQRLEKEKTEAEKVCKEYGFEYGDEKNAKDPTTGAGKIWLYLDKHPEKVKMAGLGYLTKTDLLRLAVADEGVKLGEKKGQQKEKERQAKLKATAMEGEAEGQTEDYPNADWPTSKIVEWRKKHPNA